MPCLQTLRQLTFQPALLAALALLLAACGPGEGSDDGPCTEGAVRECYEGPPGTYQVGECNSGTQTCVEGEWGKCEGQVLPVDEICDGKDNNCNGEIDEDVLNACGGCAELEHAIDAPCQNCGTWQCAGFDDMLCQAPLIPIGEECVADNGCQGVMECGDDNEARCVTQQVANACGVCDGPEVEGEVGAECEVDGCLGRMQCNEEGDAISCSARRNNCGACNQEDVDGIGAACVGDSGCVGVGKCDFNLSGLECDAPVRNACNVCGGPTLLSEVGSPCHQGNCSGTLQCDADGGLFCDAPDLNACGACGVPIEGIGESCIAKNGCPGVGYCQEGLESVVATCAPESSPNQCGLCGGPQISDFGAPCEGPGGCPGVRVCAEDQESTFCDAPGINACGGCEILENEEGESCTNDEGCSGTWICSEGGLRCDAPVRNNCGVCGDPVPEIGDNCVADNECGGKWICDQSGLDRICDAPELNECGLCDGPPLPQAHQGCFTESLCPSIFECIDGGQNVQCKPVAAGQCVKPQDVLFSEFSPEGPADPGRCPPSEGCPDIENRLRARNEFIELHNPTDQDVDLDGYMIWTRANTSDEAGVLGFRLVHVFDGEDQDAETIIPARGYWYWANVGYPSAQPPPDVRWGWDTYGGIQAPDLLAHKAGGQLWLIRPSASNDPSQITPANPPPMDIDSNDPRVADMVGWGPDYNPAQDISWYRGDPLPPFPEGSNVGRSYERKAFSTSTATSMSSGGRDEFMGNSYDSGNNANDWVLRNRRAPQNLDSPPEPHLP